LRLTQSSWIRTLFYYFDAFLVHLLKVYQPPPVVGNPAFREYNRNHPPEFNGRGEPQEAKRWIKHMEKIFRMADCTEEEKVIFATNQFRGTAEDWWDTAQRRMVTNGMGMNWNNFKQVMLLEYVFSWSESY
jgi:hypothetical protein